LHSEEMHDLYATANIIRGIKSEKDEMGGKCGMRGRQDEVQTCFNYQLNTQFLYSIYIYIYISHYNPIYIYIYIYYIIVLDMFRAIPCSSPGGQIVLLQHLVSSLSVSSRTVHRLRVDWAHP
jgi:hypothetical protein